MADAVYDSVAKYNVGQGILPAGVIDYLATHAPQTPEVIAAGKRFDALISVDAQFNHHYSDAQFRSASTALEAAEIKALGFKSAEAVINYVDHLDARSQGSK